MLERLREVYRVPNSSCPDSITNYEQITNKLQNENREIIIGTDQNVDYLNIHCVYSKDLLETFVAACLVPTGTRPTIITSESAIIIDNMYVSGNRLDYLRSGILVTDISDHFQCVYLLVIMLDFVNLKITPIPIENWTLQPLVELTPFC